MGLWCFESSFILPSFQPPIYPNIPLFLHPPMYPSTHPSLLPSICPSVHPPTDPSNSFESVCSPLDSCRPTTLEGEGWQSSAMGCVWCAEQLGRDWKVKGHTIHLTDAIRLFISPAVVLGCSFFTPHKTSLKPVFFWFKKNHFTHIGYLKIS